MKVGRLAACRGNRKRRRGLDNMPCTIRGKRIQVHNLTDLGETVKLTFRFRHISNNILYVYGWTDGVIRNTFIQKIVAIASVTRLSEQYMRAY